MTGVAGTAFGYIHLLMAGPAELGVEVIAGSLQVGYFYIQVAAALRADMTFDAFKACLMLAMGENNSLFLALNLESFFQVHCFRAHIIG